MNRNLGLAQLPNEVRRKMFKKGFKFSLMVVGENGLGKSTLIESLFLSDLYPDRVVPTAEERMKKTTEVEVKTVDIVERGVKLSLTVLDTPGFGDAIDNTETFKPIIDFIDQEFYRYFEADCSPHVSRKLIVDSRVHCCLYFISPYGHGLKPLDLEFMKQLSSKVNIIPVIAKADCLTMGEVQKLKARILKELETAGIKLYQFPEVDSDEEEEYKVEVAELRDSVPFTVVGANTLVEVGGKTIRGRQYSWGLVEVDNPDHCDFGKLKSFLVTHMQDLKEVTNDVHYEIFRKDQLKKTYNNNY